MCEHCKAERKGGPGSGNFGHEGRPGEVGGSSSDGGGGASESGGKVNPKVEAWATAKFGSEEKGKAFAKWFGRSTVVDEEGNPKVVYHGTKSDFSEFSAQESQGIYFTPDAEYADVYAGLHGGTQGARMLPAYIRIDNPKVLFVKETPYLSKEQIERYEQEGYDGLLVAPKWDPFNSKTDSPPMKDVEEVVVWKSSAIKSATGNRGTFDPADPNMNKAASLATKSLAYRRKSWLRNATIQLWEKAERHAEADIEDAVLSFLRSQRADVVKELHRIEDEKPAILADEHAAERIIHEAFDPRDWDADLRAAIAPAIARTIARGYLSSRTVQAGRRRRFPPVWRKGGAGSGNFGHAGRPGEVGGSGSGGSGGAVNPKVESWATQKFGSAEKGKAFAKWFGQSKVVDEKGEPLMVYHGTRREFETAHGAIFATQDKEYANNFGPVVMPLYAKSKAPIDLTAIPAESGTDKQFLDALTSFGLDVSDLKLYDDEEPHQHLTRHLDDIVERASEAGYDSIRINEYYEGGGATKSWLLFSSTQIKSATGNAGTFDPSDPNMNKGYKADKPDPNKPSKPTSANTFDWSNMPLTESEIAEVMSFQLPPNVTRAVFQHTKTIMEKPYWKDVNDTERQRMQWSVQHGIEEGKTLKQIAKDIQGDIGSDEIRARRIAVSETTGSLNAGHQTSAEEATEAGVVIAKTWLSIGDDKVRPEHEEADGQVVEGADAMFKVGDEEAPYPGYAGLSASSRINCRCTFLAEPVIASERSYITRHGKLFDPVYQQIARDEWEAKQEAVRTKAAMAEVKGGPGSGNFNHEGRPGEVGGSGSGGDNTSTIASTVSDSGDLYTGEANDYHATLSDAASNSNPEEAERTAYTAYESFQAGVTEKLDEFREALVDAAREAHGPDYEGGDLDKLGANIAKVREELDDVAAELVDMPREVADGSRDVASMDEGIERLHEATRGMDDRLYDIAREYLDGIVGADKAGELSNNVEGET